MQKNDRFGKEWSSNSANQEFPTDQQAQQGLSFLGATPPSYGLHDAMFQSLDWKDNWLFDQIKGITDTYGQTLDLTVNGTRTALADAISFAIANQQVATETEAGIASVATQAETDAGENDSKFVTPLKMHGSVGDISQNIAVFDVAGSYTWDVPEPLQSGLRKAHIIVAGAGGGGADIASSTDGLNGGTSSFGSICSATGGNGAGATGNSSGVAGGMAIGGDINLSGGGGGGGGAGSGSATSNSSGMPGGASYWGGGSRGRTQEGSGINYAEPPSTPGAGVGSSAFSGVTTSSSGAGATALKLVSLEGVESIEITVGAGGQGGGSAANGADGIVIIQW